MSGKWTDRGIECSKGHLVADDEGTAVCHKSKDHREEVPVGRMVREHETIALPFAESSTAGEFLTEDAQLKEALRKFNVACAAAEAAKEHADSAKRAISERLRQIFYLKGLAVLNLEALHDSRFACPKHRTARFQWIPIGYLGTAKRALRFQRSCLECSLPEHFRDGAPEPPAKAYECPHCGIVLGDCSWRKTVVNKQFAPYCDTEILCRLCGSVVDIDYGISR